MTAQLDGAASEGPVARGTPAAAHRLQAATTLPAVARRRALPGRLRKRLRVPDRHVAIVLAGAGPYTLGPGDHNLANWPVPAPEVILVDADTLPFDMQWDALPAGDDEPVTLTASLAVTVADPLRLYEIWLRTSPGSEWPLPADAVAGRLHEPVSQWAARYAAPDLNRRSAQDDLVQELRKLLAPELTRFGLVAATPALIIRCLTQANRAAMAEAARRSRELALDARMADALAQLETRDMFLDQMAAWGERTGEPLDNATLELLWQRVAPDGLPLRRAEAVSASLVQGAEEMEAASAGTPLPAERRFDQQLARLDAPVATLPDTPSDTLNRLYRGLRLGAATVGVAWALRAVFSHGFDPNNLAGLLLEGLGLVVAVVGVAAAAVTYRQVQSQAAPYWKVIQDQIAGLPAGVKLAAARARARRINLAADALILVALVAGLLLWLGRQPRALLALPVLAFVIAFALVLAARRGEQAARRQVDALISQVVRPTLPERRTADDLLRRRVREYLDRAQTNLEEAQDKLYAQQVAVDIRRIRMDSLKKAQEEAQKVHYRDAQYFANAWVPDEQVTRMLELDDDLLRRAQKLASDAKDLNKASGASVPDIDACAEATRALCNEVIEFRDVLSERSAFIGGIDK